MAHHTTHRLIAVALGAALVASPASVLASGFQLVEQNGSGLGNAYAGQAAGANDASTVFWNPANLTRLEGFQFTASVSGISVKNEFTDSGSTRPFLPTNPRTTLPVALGGNGGDSGGFTPVPNLYLSYKLNDKVWLGAGVNVPFGLKTEYEPDWVGRFHAIKSEVKTLNVNPSVAFKVSENFSIGGGANWQRLDATLSSQVPYGAVALGASAPFGAAAIGGIVGQLGSGGLAREGEALIEGDSTAWGFNAGATYHTEQFRLAASYRSKVKHDLAGDVTFGNRPSFATVGPLAALGAGINARLADGPVVTEVELPETVSLAFAYNKDKWELLADWTYTGWSSIQSLDIVRDDASSTPVSSVALAFEDTWRAGLGFNYQLNDSFKLRLGTAYDKAPVQDEHRTPRLPDAHRTWATAGFEYKLGEKSAVDLGYAHLFISDASSNLPNQDTPTSTPAGQLIGSYKGQVNLFVIQIRRQF